jgi:hypothetical protein
MIQIRKSDEYLHTDVILSKITEYDIFMHYCSNFKEVGKKFCSDLREDSNPTVSIVLWKGSLLYKDFGFPDHTFNCFGYVMHKYRVGFIDSLKIISNDFGLNLADQGTRVSTAVSYGQEKAKEIREKQRVKIKVKYRDWGLEDKDFWSQFCIPQKLLRTFEVRPIQYFWLDEKRYKCHTPSYIYHYPCGCKIYCPYEEDYKWWSSLDGECLQGYSQLPETGEIIFLTSSLKDVMCLQVLGYSAIALQSEMHMPKEKLIDEFNFRFKRVVVLYDNDFDKDKNNGQIMAEKICSKFSLDNIVIPDGYKSKDISDLIKDHGLNEAEKFLIKSIEI